MTDHLDKLLAEGNTVLGSRIPSGNRFMHDSVDSLLFHKWVLNCIGFLNKEAPEHVAQINLVHRPDIALHHQAIQIYGILGSAVDVIRAARPQRSGSPNSPQDLSLEFLTPRIVEKCADHFLAAKYDDCIHNAAKVVEVLVREKASLAAEDVGVVLMRKAFKPSDPILRFSDVAAEQEAAMNLYCGFIGFFKNPHSHKFMNITDPLTAFEVLTMANRLCTMVETSRCA
jgi:uncharacterized protein (TIGR02391 family)